MSEESKPSVPVSDGSSTVEKAGDKTGSAAADSSSKAEHHDDIEPPSSPPLPPPEEDDFPPPSEPPPPSPPLPTVSESVAKRPSLKSRPPVISINHDGPPVTSPVTSPGGTSLASPLHSPTSLATPASAIPSRLMAEVDGEHHRKSGSLGRPRSASVQHGTSKTKRFTTFLPLPHGWYEGFDPKGRKYYLNRKTKVTQWDVPDEILQYLDPLPLGWTERKDPRGKTFYVNMKLRKSQRARPGPKDDDLLALIRKNSSSQLPPLPVVPPIIPPIYE